MKEEQAAALALQLLAYLGQDEDALGRFLDESGMGAVELHQRAGDGEVLGALLDHILQNEPLLLVACEDLSLKPQDVIRARAALPGGIGDWA